MAIVAWALGVVAVLGLFAALNQLVQGPDFVDRVRIVNPTTFEFDAQVTNGARDGWVPIEHTEARATTNVEDVVDMGSTWIFRFSRAGEVAGEVRVSRADLEHSGWRVTIPDKLGDVLSNAGDQPLP